jgi:hypothetical protein
MKTKWEPADIIALILAGLIAFSILFAQIRPLITDIPLTLDAAKFVAHADGAIIAILSMYVGSKIGKKSTE